MAKRERLRSRGTIDKPDPPVETAGCWLVDDVICCDRMEMTYFPSDNLVG